MKKIILSSGLLGALFLTGCSTISEQDAKLMDTYSLCYESATTAKAYRSATLNVVAKELKSRGESTSSSECVTARKDAYKLKSIRKNEKASLDNQLQVACIQSGGIWYISYCKLQDKKVDVTVHHTN
ncbi:hypothetical protein ACFFUS_14100 [Vibrio gallaecicus]|uniref:hypothetical protein n=1 Tax=Vibrio gallaecicus TaxID=552386 RepID=UPI0010C9A9B6|nr:hypothetical protein [Vibrio gallaecicus]MDN3617015.1 hypothetical protein [Vibrio gallaecicus]